jgi:hypothetical protein
VTWITGWRINSPTQIQITAAQRSAFRGAQTGVGRAPPAGQRRNEAGDRRAAVTVERPLEPIVRDGVIAVSAEHTSAAAGTADRRGSERKSRHCLRGSIRTCCREVTLCARRGHAPFRPIAWLMYPNSSRPSGTCRSPPFFGGRLMPSAGIPLAKAKRA